MARVPNILVLAGLDPSGGAGIQADIQTLTALGCHPLPVLTCLTVQNTQRLNHSEAVTPSLLGRQLDDIARDIPIHAIKTGALGSHELVELIADFIARQCVDVPLVVDPVLAAGGGGSLAGNRLIERLKSRLLPLAALITPNGPEARRLTGEDDAARAGKHLLELGAQAVLVTGGHENSKQLTNRLFTAAEAPEQWTLPRLPGQFHGSGCTLASAIVAGLAHQLTLTAAIEQAQQFVQKTLEMALQPGRGQAIPNRGPSESNRHD